MNVNRLFSRLPIRAKLTIAFVALAVAPLLLVAGLTVRFTIINLVGFGQETLVHDVVTAGQQTEQVLERVARDAQYVARSMGPGMLAGRGATTEGLVQDFLRQATAFYQFRFLDSDGEQVAVNRADSGIRAGRERGGGGQYYALRSATLGPGDYALQPVEIPIGGGDDVIGVLPVVAVIVPMFDGSRRIGTLVGEAYASLVFRRIEDGTPSFAGTTGLVDAEGLMLFHSTDKRSWTSLTAMTSDSVVAHDLGTDPGALRGWAAGAVRVDDHVVAVTPLVLANSGVPPLYLYRVVPLSAFYAPVREFLTWVVVVGSAVVGLVMVLARLGARQFTGPILRLRRRVADVASGRTPPPASITTNDELEDLAHDFDAMALALADARRQLERALATTAAELGDIIAHSADAIIGVDADDRIRVWNRGAEELFGWPADDAVGRDAEALLAPPDGIPVSEQRYVRRELRRRGAVVNLLTRRRHRDGRLLAVSLTRTTLANADGPVGASLILRDAEGQARLMDQMRRSERLAATSLMAASLAHEINNPLGILANRIELMRRDAADRKADVQLRRDLDVVHEHVERLQRLTQDLLRFAREDDDETGEPVPLDEVAARVLRLVESSFVARNVTMQVAVPAPAPLMPAGGRALETVLVNLVLNAADAMPEGGEITIGGAVADEEVLIWVEDTGPGIPSELRERIFEPFYTTKRSGKGTGLGLAVCRGVMERTGGRIWVEDGSAGGARFVLRVPAPVAAEVT